MAGVGEEAEELDTPIEGVDLQAAGSLRSIEKMLQYVEYSQDDLVLLSQNFAGSTLIEIGRHATSRLRSESRPPASFNFRKRL